jgi:Cu-Zn family superoxide dismutase
MKTMNKILLCLSFAAAAATAGCGSDDENGSTELMNATGAWTLFPQAAGAANPAQGIAAGSAKAIETSPGQMRVELKVSGIAASRTFGAHLHKLACDDMMAGGHYQHMAGGANDPMFANATNEAWLDFTTDASGKGEATTTVAWVPAAAAAKAIVVHAMATMSGTAGTAGMAGPKLACLPVTFK